MTTFVETSVSKRVREVISTTRAIDTNAAIIGAPGVGKTMALRAYTAATPLTGFISISPSLGASHRAVLEEICNCLRISDDGTPYMLHQRIKQFDAVYEWDLSDHNNRKRFVVILDEAQNLPLKVMRDILHLSAEDGGNISFVFCGNNEVLKQVNTDEGPLAQISRRVSFRETLNNILDEDTDRIASSFGVEGMDAFRLMRAIGTKFHADGVGRVLTVARRISDQKIIGSAQILDALDILPQFRSVIGSKNKRAVK